MTSLQYFIKVLVVAIACSVVQDATRSAPKEREYENQSRHHRWSRVPDAMILPRDMSRPESPFPPYQVLVPGMRQFDLVGGSYCFAQYAFETGKKTFYR